MGGCHNIVWGINGAAKKIQYEIHHGLNWPPIDHFTHNNQPKTGSRDGGEYEGEIRQAGGGGESMVLSFWGCYKLRGGKKLK